MKLSPRLAAVAGLVPMGARVADIGCDHGYLSLYLTESGTAAHCIASDVREGPLSAAKENVRASGLEGSIELRLGDGLSGIAPEETDCVILAGMGGDTMREILQAAPWITGGGHTLVLQPQSHTDTLRLWLSGQGFSVTAERVVYDRGHLYVVFRAEWDGKGDRSPLCPYFSPALLALSAEEREPYVERVFAELGKRLEGLRAAEGREDEAGELAAHIEYIRKMVEQ
ncbi:MAG: SAM-dependent methyltransferase [Clostridia bacterium]|nr:SAM-dependent methyltransferase [Clostridia bacterium]